MRSFALILSLFFAGCSVDVIYYDDDPAYYGVRPGQEAIFAITDARGYGVPNLEIFCENMPKQYTDLHGGFRFYGGTECVVRIPSEYTYKYPYMRLEDRYGRDVVGVWYECNSGVEGFSDIDGRFYYKRSYFEGDSCKFWL